MRRLRFWMLPGPRRPPLPLRVDLPAQERRDSPRGPPGLR